MKENLQKAMFGAGCFWGVEELFRKTKGVVDTAVGFCGGHVENPTYEQVSKGDTGYAETVYLEYDPSVVSYDDLLKIFWDNHNPTSINRQGVDIGSQYRSVIFYFTEEQRKIAEKSKEELEKSGKYDRPIATEIVPAQPFYRAEEYHQRYIEKGGFCATHF